MSEILGGRVRRVLLLAGLVFAALPAAWALASTTTFATQGCGNTVSANLFIVPSGVSSVAVTATGSAGESVNGGLGPGGTGDVVSGTLSGLSSGQVLDVCVNAGGGAGGSPGANGGAGGGASGVAVGSDFTTPVLIAAGGGGGAGAEVSGGGAGLPSGGAGAPGNPCSGSACGGGGGDNSAMMAGAAGAADPGCSGCAGGDNGSASSSAGPGAGGAGGVGQLPGGGGGGAGYLGGGGGGGANTSAGGGGGGSDFCASSLAGATLSGCGVTGTNGTFGTASVVLTYTASAHVCSGSFSSPGVLKGAYPNGVVVKGVCEVNDGKARVTGTLTVTDESVLAAAFGEHHSSLTVAGNVVLDRRAVAVMGCKVNANGTGQACLDDHSKHPTLTSRERVSGSVIAHKALGLIVHNSAIGKSIKDIGGGGGPNCAVPKTGIFAAFKSPVFSDLEDSFGWRRRSHERVADVLVWAGPGHGSELRHDQHQQDGGPRRDRGARQPHRQEPVVRG